MEDNWCCLTKNLNECTESDPNYSLKTLGDLWVRIHGPYRKGPYLSISYTLNRPFFYTMAADFTVKRTAANFKTPGSLMFVPVGLLKHIENQPPLIFSKAGGGGFGNGLFEELGQMLPFDKRALSKDNRMTNSVFQLAHIAGPFVIHQNLHGNGGKRLNVFVLF